MTTLTIETNSDNDIFIAPDGNLSTVSGVDAIAQQIAEAVGTVRGELRYEPERGVDYFNTVFLGSPNVLAFTRQARAQILAVPNVTEILTFTVNQTLDVLSYNARIQTTLGVVTVTDGISI